MKLIFFIVQILYFTKKKNLVRIPLQLLMFARKSFTFDLLAILTYKVALYQLTSRIFCRSSSEVPCILYIGYFIVQTGNNLTWRIKMAPVTCHSTTRFPFPPTQRKIFAYWESAARLEEEFPIIPFSEHN